MTSNRDPIPPFILRSGSSGDITTIAQLDHESFDPPWPATAFAHALVDPAQRVVVAQHRDDVVGFCISRHLDDEIQLLRIASSRRIRRAGIGTAMLDDVLDTATARSICVTLEVSAANIAACRLYFDRGFKEEGRRNCYYRDGSDALLLSWENSN